MRMKAGVAVATQRYEIRPVIGAAAAEWNDVMNMEIVWIPTVPALVPISF
jgi:hypothetical protein